MIKFAAVILAAGASVRMGHPKLLLPWGGRSSIIGHLLDLWKQAGAEQITVVCAPDNMALDQELNAVGFPAGQRITNPSPSRGMFSSIQCAAQWTGWNTEVTHWALALGDQPHLLSKTLRGVLEEATRYPNFICQPSRNQRPRHPVVFPAPVWKQLAEARCDSLKNFLADSIVPRRLVEMDDPGLDLDIDDPSDYQKAMKLRAPGGNLPGTS